MVISNSCAIYCRYCTRKRIMYEDAVPDVEIDRCEPVVAAQRQRPPHEPLRLMPGEQQLEQPERAQEEEDPADPHARSLCRRWLSGTGATARIRVTPEQPHARAGTGTSSNTKSHGANT